MKKLNTTRRAFLGKLGAGSLAMLTVKQASAGHFTGNGDIKTLAALGGQPVRNQKAWPEWPYVDEKMIEGIVNTTKSRKWSRIDIANGNVVTFEKEYVFSCGFPLSEFLKSVNFIVVDYAYYFSRKFSVIKRRVL